jgi:hypothetical protein
MDLGRNAMFVILAVVLIVVGAYLYVNVPSGMDNTITIQGMSELQAVPDLVSVWISVETSNATAEGAKDANAEISDEIIRSLKAEGFSEDDIETDSYNIYPDQVWENNQYKNKGFKAVHNIRVKTEQFEKTGEIVDIAVDSGALIQYLQFELTKEHENELKAEALGKAAEDAQTKAEATVRGAGRELGKLVSISSSEFNYYPYPFYARAEGAGIDESAEVKQAATSISAKDLTVSAIVTATYKIG